MADTSNPADTKTTETEITPPRASEEDQEWARGFLAEWIRIAPELEQGEFAEARAEGMTDVEIAHWWLECIGLGFAATAPRLPPPGILPGGSSERD